MKGKSSCSSVALRETNRSNTSSSTRLGLALSRSVLLMTTIGLAPASSALRKTNRVWAWGPSGGVHHEQHAVDHVHDTLDLAAEVGMAGGIDDIDVVILVFERGVFGSDGDPLLLFEIHRIHEALLLAFVLVGAESAGLFQKTVDQRGFAMVHVGDNRNISDVLHIS